VRKRLKEIYGDKTYKGEFHELPDETVLEHGNDLRRGTGGDAVFRRRTRSGDRRHAVAGRARYFRSGVAVGRAAPASVSIAR